MTIRQNTIHYVSKALFSENDAGGGLFILMMYASSFQKFLTFSMQSNQSANKMTAN